ncbi:hypothetical protein [Ochrobactrum sp. Marseille-Q0166]|uniref:hypothetical protein n=1 Tax=Ochrobactrum sp. Marseille-Q0166 TaxID=2761105 RepID=UPI001AED389D|nr:hypothetical protein [Ochrobactrum sp. Marseille-Q0166]
MFAIGFAACFDSALYQLAQNRKLDLAARKGAAGVDIGQITGLNADSAPEMAKATHQICSYSNATRSNINVRPHVTTI